MKRCGEKIVFQGNWLMLKEVYFEKDGLPLTWESIERVNEHGAVIIIAKLMPSGRVILLKQFRAIINNYIIGFPAGLAESESIEAEALRELREETGYQGTVKQISPPLKSNPALINDIIYIVKVEIDEFDPVNQNPVQFLEPSEEIEVLLVEEEKIAEFLTEKHSEGFEIGIGPWYSFAV